MQTNNPIASECQKALLKRKLIHFTEVVKIFAESITTKVHSPVLFISIEVFAWTCLTIMICMTNIVVTFTFFS